MMTLTLTLPTMTCGHCERAVTAAVLGADPAAQVRVDLASHQVHIATSRPEAAMRAALQAAGYTAA